MSDVARRHTGQTEVMILRSDVAPELRLAFLGCRAPESRVAGSLYPQAWAALETLRSELLRCMAEGGIPAPQIVGHAAEMVSGSMTWAYGKARWWSLPRLSNAEWRERSGIDVATWWGLGAAAGHFDRLQRLQRGEKRRRSLTAMNAAADLGLLMEDWCGFWRPGMAREWSTAAKYRAAWRRYLKAETMAGGLHLLIIKSAAAAVVPPVSVPFRPRLVHSA